MVFLSGHSQNFGSHSFRLDLGLYFYRHQGLSVRNLFCAQVCREVERVLEAPEDESSKLSGISRNHCP